MADSVMIKHASSGLVKKVWLKPGNMGLVGHIYSLGGWFRCFGDQTPLLIPDLGFSFHKS